MPLPSAPAASGRLNRRPAAQSKRDCAKCCRWSNCACHSRCSAASWTRSIVVPRIRTLTRSSQQLAALPLPRIVRSSTAIATAGIRGICEGSGDATVALGDDYASYPVLVATAVNRLRDAGVDGPFAVALSERCYTSLTEFDAGRLPCTWSMCGDLIDGPLVWAPGLDGAVVLSMRGDDFQLTVGQDFSIGYLDHDAERVRLYIEESFTFWLQTPRGGGAPGISDHSGRFVDAEPRSAIRLPARTTMRSAVPLPIAGQQPAGACLRCALAVHVG